MHWNIAQKLTFRFFACYIFFYTMSNQFLFSFAFEGMWQKVVPWFAEYILHLPEKITIFTNGSGDTTYNYVSLLVYALISFIITIIWSILDRERPNYQKLLELLIILVRYYIIYQMVIYGLAKIFYLQFQPPRFARLVQPYGDSSPMGILWTFMGFSKGYTMFTGFAEFLGGILLLFRKTRTLGALVVFGVMANVMALNYFYDVPVKLLSTHLVLLSLFLISLDTERLWNFLIANKPTSARIIPVLFEKPKHEKIKNIVKWSLVSIGLGFMIYQTYSSLGLYGPNAPKPLLYGLYEVENFERNGVEIPPLITDSTRWRRMSIDWKDRSQVQMMNDKMQSYTFKPDSSLSIITYHPRQDTSSKYIFEYAWIDSVHLELKGIQGTDTLAILMKSKKKEDFLLMSRKFRWINEYPFNR